MADSTQPGEQSNADAIRKAKKAAANKARYEAKREEILEKNRKYRIANAAKLRDSRKANGDAVCARRRDYYKRNREKILAANRAWRAKNSEQVRASDSRKYFANKEKIKERQKLYTAKNAVKNRERVKAWRKANPERVRQWRKERRKVRIAEDPAYKAATAMRRRLYMAIRGQVYKGWNIRSGEAVRMLGCSMAEFVHHIESLWSDGMTWGNWSVDGWHIDHIIPLSAFDLSDADQLKAACHYTNLRPLWAADNRRKSNKVPNQHLFGFGYAAKIADAATVSRKRRYKA